MKIIVKFTKIGNKVKYKLPFKMFCKRMQTFIANSGTLDKSDTLITSWLGKDSDSLFKKTKTVFVKVNMNQIYDKCDSPRNSFK